MFKRLTMAGFFLWLIACSARAADLQHVTWTGFYLGMNAGYAANRDDLGGAATSLDLLLPGAGVLAMRSRSDGLIAGGQLGYDHQFGRRHGIVLGIETDLAYTGLDETVLAPVPGVSPFGLGFQSTYRERLQALGTVRGRLG